MLVVVISLDVSIGVSVIVDDVSSDPRTEPESVQKKAMYRKSKIK